MDYSSNKKRIQEQMNMAVNSDSIPLVDVISISESLPSLSIPLSNLYDKNNNKLPDMGLPFGLTFLDLKPYIVFTNEEGVTFVTVSSPIISEALKAIGYIEGLTVGNKNYLYDSQVREYLHNLNHLLQKLNTDEKTLDTLTTLKECASEYRMYLPQEHSDIITKTVLFSSFCEDVEGRLDKGRNR